MPDTDATSTDAAKDKPAAEVKEANNKVKTDGDSNCTDKAQTSLPTVAEVSAVEVPKKMSRAIFLNGFGGPKNIKVAEREELPVVQGQVAVRVKACGVNFLDLMTRQGLLVDGGMKTPFIQGCECAGEVESTGESVSDIQEGDRVLVLMDQGAWADHVVVPADRVFRIPKSMSFQEAAGVGFSALPAYIILHDLLSIRPNDLLLVHSAGGALGLAVAQMAKSIGGVQLIGTASRHKHEEIKEHYTLLLDHDADYVTEIKKLYPGGIHAVMDCLSGEDINKGISLLKPMGKYILYGAANFVSGETKSFFNAAKSWWKIERVSPQKLHDENRSIGGFCLKSLLFKQQEVSLVRDRLTAIFDLYSKNEIKFHIDSEWAMEDICEAMQKLSDRKNIGKVVITSSLEPKQKVNEEQNSSKSEEKSQTPPASAK